MGKQLQLITKKIKMLDCLIDTYCEIIKIQKRQISELEEKIKELEKSPHS